MCRSFVLVFLLSLCTALCPSCPPTSCSCPFGCVEGVPQTLSCPSDCGVDLTALPPCPRGSTEARSTQTGCPKGQRKRVCQISCPTVTKACKASAQCADYVGCLALGLGGNCCPSDGGVRLGCCDSAPILPVSLSPTTAEAPTSTPLPTEHVSIVNRQLYVDGKPFDVHGVCYSPVPIGESVAYPPHGDYFTLEYAYLWMRDLPMIKLMGANAIRIYGWNNTRDHTDFLDAARNNGLYVLVTYFLGSVKETPIRTPARRQAVVADFAAEASKYAKHPAILSWSFGNEVNGIWNGFITELNDEFACGWTPSCLNNIDPSSACVKQSDCVYRELFKWIDQAAEAAGKVTTRPITSGFADVDFVLGTPNRPDMDKLARNAQYAKNVGYWALQVYRGKSFGDLFKQFAAATRLPLLVSEYGVDAYNDPCMWPENANNGMCFASTMDPQGGSVATPNFIGCAGAASQECRRPGSLSQRDWDLALTSELQANCANRGGVVMGGFLMAWIDEYWKGVNVENKCVKPCLPADAGPTGECRTKRLNEFLIGGSAGCIPRSHITCGVVKADISDHSLCGYFLPSQPDQYLNEEWFGITEPVACDAVDGLGFGMNSIKTRPVFHAIKQLWTGTTESTDELKVTCEQLTPCHSCVTSVFKEETEAQLKQRCGVKCNLTAASQLVPTPAGASSKTLNENGQIIVITLLTTALVVIAALVMIVLAQRRCRKRDEKLEYVSLNGRQ